MNGLNKYQIFKDATLSPHWHMYVHIPFCPRKCRFCMYYTVRNFSSNTMEKLSGNLIREIENYASMVESAMMEPGPTLTSIYFGGGTPAELGEKKIADILAAVRALFSVHQNVEISLEAFPDDDLSERIAFFSKIGVTRLSVGVQSLDSSILGISKRPAVSESNLHQIIDRSHDYGLTCNVDLMYGLPGQSEEDILNSLRKVVSCAPDHVTNYRCVAGPYTAAFRLRDTEIYPRLTAAQCDIVRNDCASILDHAGYFEYASGHFASYEKSRCIHELGEWSGEDFLGIGPAAMSYINGISYKNVPSIKSYGKWLEMGKIIDADKLSQEDIVRRAALLSLTKLMKLDTASFQERFSRHFYKVELDLSRLARLGVLNRSSNGVYTIIDGRVQEFIFEFSSSMSAPMKKKIMFGRIT